MSYFMKNPFASQAIIDQHYDIGGWAEKSKIRDQNTSGRYSTPNGADRFDYIHRYLNGELNLPPGQHTHAMDSLSGPTNTKVKPSSFESITISPLDKALNYKIT